MFGGASDDAFARGAGGEDAADRQVDGFGAAAGEDHFAYRAADEVRDFGAGFVDRLAGALAETVDTGGVAIPFREERQHGLDHAGGGLGGGVVIEVDQVHSP